MFQRDYILRMIEMMGDLMRRVMELLDELSRMRLLEEACRRRCGLPLQTLESLTAESLIDLLAPAPRLFASELLCAYAAALSMALEDARALKLKSLRLLVSLREEGELCELRAGRVQGLKSELLDLLTPDDLMQCALFLSRGGAYADMEDAVFEAAERCAPNELLRCVQQGEALLREAARAPEGELALGRTSSHELRVSARELAGLMPAPSEARPPQHLDKGVEAQ